MKRYEDVLCDDFGEIKINMLGKFYKVLIGTGFNNTYPFYMLSAELVNFFEEKNEILCAFQFIDDMISSLQLNNRGLKSYDKQKLHIPPEKYFFDVYKYYKINTFNVDKELWKKVLCSQYIEQQHFVEKDGVLYLLFNTSFLIDFMVYYIEKIEESKLQNYIDMSLSRILYDNYDMTTKNIKVMSPIRVSFSNNGETFIKGTSYIEDNSKSILILSSRYLKENKIKQSYKQKIISELTNGKLNIFMPYKAKFLKGRTINSNSKLQFIEYISYINIRQQGVISIQETNKDVIPILDLIHIIVRTKDIEELYDFLEIFKQTNLMFGNLFSGVCSIYEMWKNNNHLIEQGAVSFGMVMSEMYMEDYYIKDMYKIDYQDFPFSPNNKLFSSPYQWDIHKIKGNYYSLKNNAVDGFGGYLCVLNNINLFLSHDAALLGDVPDIKDINNSKTLDDLLFEVLFEYKNLISKSLDGNIVYQIINIPFNSKEFHNLKKITDYYYVGLTQFENIYRLKITIDYDMLFDLLENSLNRKQEIELVKLILKSFNCCNDKVLSLLDKDIEKPRICALTTYKCPYIKNDICLTKWPSSLINAQTRKKLAYLCKSINIKPGKYKSMTALNKIRKIQEVFQAEIEKNIINKDKYALHKLFLSILAQLEHKKKICNIKYKLANNSRKNSEAEELIKNREEAKDQIRFLNYLIETNLSCSHNSNSSIEISEEEIEQLLSYGEWFVNLQDTGDKLRWEFKDATLNIEYDYTISSLSKRVFSKKDLQLLSKRSYKNNDFIPAAILETSFDNLTSSLSFDLGFSLKSLFNILDYLRREFNYTFKDSSEIDVYQVNRKELLEDVESILKTKNDIKDILKALDYLILDESRIKLVYTKGVPVEQGLIPIWERENRIDRFELKPIIQVNSELIFSPPVINSLFERWQSAIDGFYPPYEYGLSNFKAQIEIVQKKCQLELENAILNSCKEFMGPNDFCEKNVYLHKKFPEQTYPDNLGDYDCLFIDRKNKTIWNLESKFLQYVGSISEFSKHQDSFYNKNKKDEKFAKRIDYLQNNYKKILSSLGFSQEDYIIKSYMVKNKVFISLFKKVPFDIITFDELNQILKQFYT